MNKTIFIAAMLAVTTVLAAGLTVLPGSVQEAQANPCATENENEGNQAGVNVGLLDEGGNDERECTIIGNDIEFDED
jgi:hypothetical protein